MEIGSTNQTNGITNPKNYQLGFHSGLGINATNSTPNSKTKHFAADVSFGATEEPSKGVSVATKHTYAEKRSAANILKRQDLSTITTPINEWLQKVDWAKSVLPNFSKDERPTVQRALPKRPCSQQIGGPMAKRSRKPAIKRFAEIAKERSLIGVFDQSSQDGNQLHSQWKWIESALAARCFELLLAEPGDPPVCKDVGWYQGNVKVIACDNRRSAELYKSAVASVSDVYPGAKLIAVDWNEIPARPRARVWVPSTIKDPDAILKMLQLCNPQLPTADWRVVKVETHQGPRNQAVLILNQESLVLIEAAKGEINFGFNSITVKVYKSDAAATFCFDDNPFDQGLSLRAESNDKLSFDEQGLSLEDEAIKQYSSDAATVTRSMQELWLDDDSSSIGDLSDDTYANEAVQEHSSQDVPSAFAAKLSTL